MLLVEDDANLSYIIKSSFEDVIGGYEVTVAGNGEEGLKFYHKNKPDIIIADVEMPVMNGFEMVARIRESDEDTPILFASARVTPKDVTSGYKMGANNYVKKPFVPDELDAHIRGILAMKKGKHKKEAEKLQIGCYILNAKDSMLQNELTGEKQTLTFREAQILELLAQNKNEVVKRDTILARFWNTEEDYFASRSLDVFITKLRKRLSEDSTVEIKTLRGIGLMLATDAHE